MQRNSSKAADRAMRRAGILLAAFMLGGAIVAAVVQSRADDVIYRTRSQFNEIFVSEDSRGIRTLRFEPFGARQSVVKPGDPDYIELLYAKAIHVGLALAEAPKRVLIVGLGGGTIPRFLRHHFPDLAIDVVEIDPAVVRVARSHFGFRPDGKMRVFVADGRRFIEESGRVYDVVYLDAYSADSVPYSLSTYEFLRAVQDALRPGGVVVGNVWSSRSNELYVSMVRTYQEVFRQVAINDVQGVGNRIVIGTDRRIGLSEREVAKLAAALADRGNFSYDLEAMVEWGYHAPDQIEQRGSVLRDR